MIAENRARLFTVSLLFAVEQVLPQGYKGLIVISLGVSPVDDEAKEAAASWGTWHCKLMPSKFEVLNFCN